MYASNELGKIKIRKFIKRAVGKKAGLILKAAVKTAVPFVAPAVVEAAVKAFEKKKGRSATPEEIEAITAEQTPQIFGVPWYLPVAGIGLIGLLFFLKRR